MDVAQIIADTLLLAAFVTACGIIWRAVRVVAKKCDEILHRLRVLMELTDTEESE